MLESQGVIGPPATARSSSPSDANPLNSSLRLLLHARRAGRRCTTCSSCGGSSSARRPRSPPSGTRTPTSPRWTRRSRRWTLGARADERRPRRRFIDGDLRFHLAVAEATGNGLVLHSMHARARRHPPRAADASTRSPTAPRAPSASTGRSGPRSPPATPSVPARRCTTTSSASRPTSRREALMAELGYVGLGVMGGRDRAAPARRRPHRHGLEPHAARRPSG